MRRRPLPRGTPRHLRPSALVAPPTAACLCFAAPRTQTTALLIVRSWGRFAVRFVVRIIVRFLVRLARAALLRGARRRDRPPLWAAFVRARELLRVELASGAVRPVGRLSLAEGGGGGGFGAAPVVAKATCLCFSAWRGLGGGGEKLLLGTLRRTVTS